MSHFSSSKEREQVTCHPIPKERGRSLSRTHRKGNSNLVERERKYICPRTLVEEAVDLSLLDEQHIVQSYFDKQIGQVLVPLAVELHLITPSLRDLEVTQARLRRVEQGTSTAYSLAIKGRVPGLLATERVELPIALGAENYEALQKLACAGTITKRRFTSAVHSNENLKLEIDIPELRYGRDGKSENLSLLELAFIEIEIASRSVDNSLRDGLHEISVIHRSLDISKDREEHELFRKHLSWPRLARKGLACPKLQKVLSEVRARLRG